MAIKSGFTSEDLAKMGPDYLTKKRLLAEALLNDTTKQRKIAHPLQGLAQLAETLSNGMDVRRLDEAQLSGRSAADKAWSAVFGGSSSPSVPPQASSQGQAQIPMPGAAGEIAGTSPVTGDTYEPFITTVKEGGLTNPYGLAAVAATGRAESGWSAANANRTWDDPSESGQPGRAGGIMSWRGPRYQALAATGDLSPQGQAKFFLNENPALIQKLNNSKSVEEAQQLMNEAWAFAGYNRPGGEVDRRLGYAKGYLPQFQGQTEVASLDAGMPPARPQGGGYVDPEVSARGAPPPPSPRPAGNQQLAQAVTGGSSDPTPTPEQLMSVINDPWMSDDRKNLAKTLLGQQIERGNAQYEQQLKQQDPAYRIGLEKSQLEVDRLRNPQTPDSVQALDLRAQRAGLQPGTKEYTEFMLTGGNKGITVDARQMGNIPPGYQVQYDAEGRPESMTPIPGSPAALEMEAANRQKDMRTDNKATSGSVVVQDIDRAFNTMEGATLPTTGMAGELLSNVPGTAARDVRGLMDTIKANATFDKLQQMREASPTGGALGAVSDTENKLLAAAIGNLEQSQSEGQFKDNLARVQNIYLDIIHGKGNGPERRKLSFEGKEPEAEVPLDDLLKKYGG